MCLQLKTVVSEQFCGMYLLRLMSLLLEWTVRAQELLVSYLGFGDFVGSLKHLSDCLLSSTWWTAVADFVPSWCLLFSAVRQTVWCLQHSGLSTDGTSSCVSLSLSYQICYQHRSLYNHSSEKKKPKNQTNCVCYKYIILNLFLQYYFSFLYIL